jgi:hypothetical protein
MVKSFFSPDVVEFTNNWETIDLTNDWLRENDRGAKSIGTSAGGVYLSGSNMGYNSGGSYDRITSRFDLKPYRLISFSASCTTYCYHGSHSCSVVLTDGTNSLALISASASSSTTSSSTFGHADNSAYFTILISGTTATIYRLSQSNAYHAGAAASVSTVSNAYALDFSSWGSLKLRFSINGGAASGYGIAEGNSKVIFSPILATKKVIGSMNTLIEPQ